MKEKEQKIKSSMMQMFGHISQGIGFHFVMRVQRQKERQDGEIHCQPFPSRPNHIGWGYFLQNDYSLTKNPWGVRPWRFATFCIGAATKDLKSPCGPSVNGYVPILPKGLNCLAVPENKQNLMKSFDQNFQLQLDSLHWIYLLIFSALNIPPVSVENAISKPQQFRHDIQTGMKEPIEEYQPDDMIWHLKRDNSLKSVSILKLRQDHWRSTTVTITYCEFHYPLCYFGIMLSFERYHAVVNRGDNPL